MWARPTSGSDASSSAHWPTPTAKGNYANPGTKWLGQPGKAGDGLMTAVRAWATPLARDTRSCPGPEAGAATNARPLTEQVPKGPPLNPAWVESLMGFPGGWTALDLTEHGRVRAEQKALDGKLPAPSPTSPGELHDSEPSETPSSPSAPTSSGSASRSDSADWTGAPPVVNKTPDLPIEPERNNTMTMPYVRVVSGTAKAFSGQSFELGPKTLIVGPIGSGKTALVNMIELALGGFASDLAGRGQISSDSMLLEILAAGRTSLEAQVVMSDGAVYRWAKAGRTAAVHEGDLKKAPIFVLRDLVNVVDGSEEKAQRWLLALMGRGLTRSQVLEVLPAPLHTLYATLADQAAGSEVDRLLATREVVRKKEREASSSAKAAKSVVQAVEATVAPQGVPPTEAEMQDAEAKVQSYQAMAEAWASRSAIVEQDGKIVAEYHAAVEVLKQVQALMASAPGKVDTTKLAAVRTVLEVAIDQWKHGATDCALCGSVVKPADMIGRADAMVASIKSTIEASAASVELARKLEAVQKQINHLVLQHNRLVDSMPPEPAVPASLIAATLQSAKTYRDSLHQRRGAAAPVRAASDEAFKHTAAAQEYKLLLDALDEVVERTIKRLVTAFEAKADKYLPEGQLFGLQLSPFRYGYRAGGQFAGVVQPGWSGGQRVQLLCAMAAAVAEINPSLPTISIPEERSFDPDGLRATLDALAKAPGQIILTSTVMPTNRGGKVPGWTIIDLSGEKKEKKPKKEKEAKTEEPLAPLALAPAAPGGSPVPMMVPLGPESLGPES